MAQAIPQTMRAAAVDAFGGPITLHTLPVPEVGPDEILIRVESAGIGVWDPFEAEGGFHKLYGGGSPRFPYVPGSEGAGTVVDVGRHVGGVKPGDRVYAVALMNPKGGFYAEYVAVNVGTASPIRAGLTVEQAGVMPVDALTALSGLADTLKLQPSEWTMIFGASGGIGHMAVQLARRIGAHVFAVASGSDGEAFVGRLGANAVVDGRKDDVVAAAQRSAPRGLDAALLTAGGPAAERALDALRKGGRVAYPHGVEPEPQPRPGITINAYDGDINPQAIARLNQLIEQSPPFEVHVARTFQLEQVPDAHRMLNEHFLGKLALLPTAG